MRESHVSEAAETESISRTARLDWPAARAPSAQLTLQL